ncbi:MAG: hypothetical protein PHI97_30685 [Desulfobulbus sp.]|nr:hypothetical protein [Desulfobulbus sp.]
MKKCAVQLICTLIFCVATCSAEGADFPDFPLPMYPAATNQKTHLDKPAKGVKAVTYQVATVFPARSLTDFFNKEMIDRGFKPYNDSLLALKEFKWNNFNPRTGNWDVTSSPPARYSAKWRNEKADQLVWLSIDFKEAKGSKRDGIAFVSVHVGRYSAYAADRNEIMKIEHNQKNTPDQNHVR